MKKQIAGIVGMVALASGLTACGGSDDPGSSQDGKVEGDIVVITNRTDIVDTVFADYKKTFEAKYPDVTVSFESSADYEGEITTRMSTEDYGDVLLIPNSVAPADLPDFFEPLGTVEELAKDYRFVETEQAYDGQSYGITITGNAQGIVYNKSVWTAAGLTDMPTTPEEFIEDMQAIKDETDAIPLYTNYSDGWPLAQWEQQRGGVSADPGAVNALADTDEPWAEGEEHFIIDSLLFDVVEAGLTEPDPLTTNWDESKAMLARGDVGTMVLGSWAISQVKGLAKKPDDIGYMPFPNQVDGAFHSVTGGDYENGINVNSEHKAAARAWIDWFADESGYATDQGGLTPTLDGPMPATLADFEELGVEYFELEPAAPGEESLVNDIDQMSEIGLFDHAYRQLIVDAARGASGETKEEVFDDLNQKWTEARASIG